MIPTVLQYHAKYQVLLDGTAHGLVIGTADYEPDPVIFQDLGKSLEVGTIGEAIRAIQGAGGKVQLDHGVAQVFALGEFEQRFGYRVPVLEEKVGLC